MIMSTKTVQDRFNAQRRALGLPEVDYAAIAVEMSQMPAELLGMDMLDDVEFAIDEDQEALLEGEEIVEEHNSPVSAEAPR